MAEAKSEKQSDIRDIPVWRFDLNSIKSNFENIRYLTPTKNILERIEQCPSEKTPILLITTGAYCPVHRMHIEMHDMARNYIESNFNASVVGSLLSASHDEYVMPKIVYSYGEKFFLDGNTRARLIDLAINKHPLIEQDLFEVKADRFLNFHEVVDNRQAYFDWECRNRKVRSPIVVMLVGEDMLKCHLYPPPKGVGLALLRRKGTVRFKSRWPQLDMKQQWEEKVFLVEAEGELEVSSTKVRLAAVEKKIDILNTMLQEDVAAEIIALWTKRDSNS